MFIALSTASALPIEMLSAGTEDSIHQPLGRESRTQSRKERS